MLRDSEMWIWDSFFKYLSPQGAVHPTLKHHMPKYSIMKGQ